MAYAESTSVPVRQTLDEIEKLVRKYGGSGIQQLTSDEAIAILFAGEDRRIRFVVKFGARPDTTRAITAWEKRKRSLARGLLLCIKSKFVSIEAEIETFEEAFLAQTIMPDGQTVMQHAGPRVIEAYKNGGAPEALLPDFSK